MLQERDDVVSGTVCGGVVHGKGCGWVVIGGEMGRRESEPGGWETRKELCGGGGVTDCMGGEGGGGCRGVLFEIKGGTGEEVMVG